MEAVSRSATSLGEVARAAGVSRATASKVLGGHPQVSESARQAVERAAAELGYLPDRAARSLVAGRSESVGVLIPDPSSQLFGDPMLARLLGAIGEELSANGLQMVLFAPQSATDIERLDQYLAGGHVDAVLLLALHESESLLARLQARGIPMVFGGSPRTALLASYVDVDNHAGGRSATQHLVAQGRRRIADIGFDDSPIAMATQPPLSSVRQPVELMGREMAKLALNMSTVRGQSPRQIVLDPELALRESTVGSAN